MCVFSLSTVVGYDTETTHDEFNYVVPMFRTTGGDKTATELQQIQLDSEISSFEVTCQFLTKKRKANGVYDWICADEASGYVENWPAGQGLWIDDETQQFPAETILVGVGNSIQLDMGTYEGSPIQCAGQVSDEDLTYTTHDEFNFIGNPFPANNSIQNIQLGPDISSFEVTFQFLTKKRKADGVYDWICADEASGYVENWPQGLGLWIDDETQQYPDPEKYMKPGEAVQLDMGEYDGEVVTVYAPIEI